VLPLVGLKKNIFESILLQGILDLLLEYINKKLCYMEGVLIIIYYFKTSGPFGDGV
jgi:hypothetical protein